MRIFFLLSLLSTVFTISLNSQSINRCDLDHKMQEAIQRDTSYRNIYQEIKSELAGSSPTLKSRQMPIVIAVHVIIVHPPGQSVGNGSNLSLARVQSQIDVINEDFRRTNGDAFSTPSVFSAVDTNIEFCLASVDPSGNPTDGITRYATNSNFDGDEFAIKAATGWDRSQYMNIWVAPTVGALGYAYLPSTTSLPNATLDGCVIQTGTFGGPGFATLSPYDLGRTTTHEVGHYLGLGHVWGGGCGSDDGIADTPNQQGSNFGCPNHPSPSCGNSGDMFMNYMDYVNDGCMNAFSQGQSNRMNTILSSSRSSLLFSSSNCQSIAPLFSQVATTAQVSCFGDNDGAVQISSTGGLAPYQYILSGLNQTNDTGIFTDLIAGNYLVTVNDGSGQTNDVNFTIGTPDPLSIFSLQITDVDCNGNSTGNLGFGAIGGNGNTYQFSVNGSPYSSNNFYDNLVAGSYLVEAIDIKSCTDTITFFVSEPENLSLDSYIETEISCFGDNNASIVVQGSGGTPQYEYSIDGQGNQVDTTFNNLPAGLYTLFATDSNGCTTSEITQVDQPAQLVIDSISYDELSCSETTTDLNIFAQGGTQPFSFSINGGTPQSSNTFQNLSSDNYLVGILDNNDCLVTSDILVDGPDSLTITLSSSQSVECFGDTNGDAQLVAMGNGPFTYTLDGVSNEDGYFDGLTSQTYLATVTSNDGCSQDFEFEIEQNSTLALAVSITQELSCWDATDGRIELSSTGGTGNKMYSINGDDFQSSNVYNGLAAGNYDIIAEDQNGCQILESITLVAPDTIKVENLTSLDISCFGENDGSISITATGGTGTLSYALNGGMLSGETLYTQLAAQDYSLVISDENGCSISQNVSLSTPEQIETEYSTIQQSNCDGDPIGEVAITASGGSGGYSYTLNGASNNSGAFSMLPAGMFSYTVTDSDGCSITDNLAVEATSDITAEIMQQNEILCFGESTASIIVNAEGGAGNFSYGLGGSSNNTGIFTDLPAGNIDVVITDADGCFSLVSYMIESPQAIGLTQQNLTNGTCNDTNDGTVSYEANGGIGTYSYSLEGINNTNGQFTNLPSGSYTMTVSDQNGCTTTDSFTITVPDALQVSSATTAINDCSGDANAAIAVTGQGGTGAYTFSLDQTSNDTGIFENLPTGDYEVIITDANGCSNTTSLFIPDGEAIEISEATSNDVSCNEAADGSIMIEIEEGANYTFTLDNGDSNNTGSFANLSAGEYEVTIMNQAGCTSSVTNIINQPALLVLNATATSSNACEGCGMITASAAGGTPPYQYKLDDGNLSTNGNIEVTQEGSYEITVIDDKGCEQGITVIYEAPEAPLEFSYNIYPNPSRENPTLEVTLPSISMIKVFAYDARGQYIGQIISSLEYPVGTSEIPLSVSDLSAGVYILQVDINTDKSRYFKYIKL